MKNPKKHNSPYDPKTPKKPIRGKGVGIEYLDVSKEDRENAWQKAALWREINLKVLSLPSMKADEEGASTASQSETPHSYNEARSQVSKYIVDIPNQSFDDVVGMEKAAEILKEAITAPIKHKQLYEMYDMKMPKGALLFGPPGCGKTLFARAAASEMRRLYGEGNEFLSISGAEIQSVYVGQTEKIIKSIFNFAKEYKSHHGHPLLVFIDEADSLLPDRTGRNGQVYSWEESRVSVFLSEMDGIAESGAFVLLATNRPEVIDQAILRDGRCDFKIKLHRPTRDAVEIILRRNFTGVPIKNNSIEEMVFAASESFYDPHKIIFEARALKIDLKGKVHDEKGKSLCLEHIISGAMVESVSTRAKRYAFNRDKEKGILEGVTVKDVVDVVSDIFEENKELDHSFAVREFKREFEEELNAG